MKPTSYLIYKFHTRFWFWESMREAYCSSQKSCLVLAGPKRARCLLNIDTVLKFITKNTTDIMVCQKWIRVQSHDTLSHLPGISGAISSPTLTRSRIKHNYNYWIGQKIIKWHASRNPSHLPELSTFECLFRKPTTTYCKRRVYAASRNPRTFAQLRSATTHFNKERTPPGEKRSHCTLESTSKYSTQTQLSPMYCTWIPI